MSRSLLVAVLMNALVSLPVAAQQPPVTTDKKDERSRPAHPGVTTGVETGSFPKSINIPGTDASFSIGGYAKVDFIQDFSGIGNAYDFQTSSIPVSGSAGSDLDGRTTIHARETRLNLEVRAARHFRVFAEGDFYGDKNAFRLRHAYGEFGRLLGGQTWSTFQDISARPLTVDFEGPDAEVFLRQALMRWTQPVGKGVQWALALETPTPDILASSEMTGVAQSDLPDFASHLRWSGTKGHAQLGGVLRKLRFDGEGGTSNQSTAGWGVNTSFNVKPFGKDELMGQFAYGEGIAHYIEALSGQGSDAAFASDGSLEAIPETAVVLGFTRHWSSTLRSGISYAFLNVDNVAAQPASAIRQTQDFRVNLFYTPYRLVDVAWEVLWGRRENRNGSYGDAVRAQVAFIYRFN